MYSLNDLNTDETATIYKICDSSHMRRRFFDIGLIEGTTVTCVGQSPQKDPKAYLIRGAVIALRNEDAQKILIRKENEKWD